MPNSREHDHLLNCRFRIEIEGVTQGAFSQMSGLESVTDVIEYADGDDNRLRKRPGRTRFSNMLLTRGVLINHELWEWYKSVMQGAIERKSLQLDASSHVTLVEELEIAVELIELG